MVGSAWNESAADRAAPERAGRRARGVPCPPRSAALRTRRDLVTRPGGLLLRPGPDGAPGLLHHQRHGERRGAVRGHALHRGQLHHRRPGHRVRGPAGCHDRDRRDRLPARGRRSQRGGGRRRGRLVHRRLVHRGGWHRARQPGARAGRPQRRGVGSGHERNRALPAALGHDPLCGRRVHQRRGADAQPHCRTRRHDRCGQRLESRRELHRARARPVGEPDLCRRRVHFDRRAAAQPDRGAG